MRAKLTDINVSADVAKLNPSLLAGTPVKASTEAHKEQTMARACARSDKLEKTLQAECEAYLVLNGYKRITKGESVDKWPDAVRGCFFHMVRPKGNPILLDLLILSPCGAYLHVELKTADRWQAGQKRLIKLGYGVEAWDLKQFIGICNAWPAWAGSVDA